MAYEVKPKAGTIKEDSQSFNQMLRDYAKSQSTPIEETPRGNPISGAIEGASGDGEWWQKALGGIGGALKGTVDTLGSSQGAQIAAGLAAKDNPYLAEAYSKKADQMAGQEQAKSAETRQSEKDRQANLYNAVGKGAELENMRVITGMQKADKTADDLRKEKYAAAVNYITSDKSGFTKEAKDTLMRVAQIAVSEGNKFIIRTIIQGSDTTVMVGVQEFNDLLLFQQVEKIYPPSSIMFINWHGKKI